MAGQTPGGIANQVLLIKQQREYLGLPTENLFPKDTRGVPIPNFQYQVTAADYGWQWMNIDRMNGISDTGLSKD